MQNKIRIIFIGTPHFAVPSLRAILADEDFEVVGVITQPDKRVGRKQDITPPPVKAEALKNDIPVWQPQKISDFRFPISDFELIVVVAYAQIIPESILNMPKYGCINVHGSLLPKYRGAACVQAAIADGEKETGVTIMKMDKGLDTGPILSQDKIEIKDDDTAGSMFVKLAESGAKILVPTLKKYIAGDITPRPQDDAVSSYVGMLRKEDGRIRWFENAETIERFIRSRQPWPGAWTKIGAPEDGRMIKINEADHSSLPINDRKLGEVFLHGGTMAVQCGRNSLAIKKIQPEGKREMEAEEFLRGHRNIVGQVLN